MLASQDLGDTFDDFGMSIGHILLFAVVGGKVIKFDPRVAPVQVASHTFPIAQSHGLLSAITAKPVKRSKDS